MATPAGDVETCQRRARGHDLVKHFPDRPGGRHSVVHAVDGVSFDLGRGEALGLVGESGCGKSTLARTVVRLLSPTSGSISFEGTDITAAAGRDLRHIRARLRIVFQDPFSSLDPRRTVGDIVGEPLRIHRRDASDADARVREPFELVGLDPCLLRRYPHELSSGQRQRIGIARALALEPRVLVLDEPVSSLDVPTHALYLVDIVLIPEVWLQQFQMVNDPFELAIHLVFGHLLAVFFYSSGVRGLEPFLDVGAGRERPIR